MRKRTLPTPTQEEMDAISTQMYSGMNMDEAVQYYQKLLENPNVKKGKFSQFAYYTDPNTGRTDFSWRHLLARERV